MRHVTDLSQLPTFDLAISHLYPQVRNDFRFLTSFFLIRILFHAVVFLDCARPSSRAVTDGSYLPAIMYALAGFLHVSWFRGGLNGYVKRQRVAKSAVADPTLHEPILDTAVEVDSTVLEGLPSMVPGAVTPDDFPIITPYTPSQTPMSLRDSYVFPTIVMPTMPNLTAMSIPAIPSISDITAAFPKSLHSEHLSFGFKDVVKTRWDEQRGNFAGMGQRGREMALNLGGLGMRRRGTAVSSDDGEEVASRLEARG